MRFVAGYCSGPSLSCRDWRNRLGYSWCDLVAFEPHLNRRDSAERAQRMFAHLDRPAVAGLGRVTVGPWPPKKLKCLLHTRGGAAEDVEDSTATELAGIVKAIQLFWFVQSQLPNQFELAQSP